MTTDAIIGLSTLILVIIGWLVKLSYQYGRQNQFNQETRASTEEVDRKIDEFKNQDCLPFRHEISSMIGEMNIKLTRIETDIAWIKKRINNGRNFKGGDK